MKRLLPLLLLFTLFLPLSIYAQEDSTDVALMEVSLWPDFDDASLLVLATGTMPTDANLPASITFPLPDGYDRLVVARVTDDNNMIDDLETTITEDGVTFSSPESRFRVEYYIPYTATDDQRQIDFSWVSPDLTIDTFQVAIQRPAAATEMNIDPEPIGEMAGGSTGLTEYVLPEVALPAGTPYEMMANYAVSSRLLSIDLLSDNNTLPAADNTPPASADSAADDNSTLIIIFGVIGVLLIAVAVGWYIYSSRQNSKPPQKPKPTRSKKKRVKAGGFCRECGSSINVGAKFCSSCGTAVKE